VAESLTIGGVDVKIRHPWGAWALSLITLGIYGLVWWYKINRELRDYSAALGKPLDNDPTLSVLALFPGGIVIVPAIWTNWTTPERIATVQEMSGQTNNKVMPLLSLVLALFALNVHIVYLQSALNGVWEEARSPAAPAPV